MKRIYVTVALLAGLGMGVSAQVVDLQAVVDIDSGTCLKNGTSFQVTDSTAPMFGAWGIYSNGPESLGTGDNILFVYPRSRVSSEGTTVWIAPLNADVLEGDFAYVESNLPVDSVNTLLDIDKLLAGSTNFGELLVPRESFVTGKEYGFYLYVFGVGADPNVPPVNTDDDPANNWAYVKVIWNCEATSIADMIKNVDARPITVYPNPATEAINFDYTFEKTATASAKIIDVTGRTLLVQEFGKMVAGKHSIKVDVSSLKTGMYMVEFNDGTNRATSKFTINK